MRSCECCDLLRCAEHVIRCCVQHAHGRAARGESGFGARERGFELRVTLYRGVRLWGDGAACRAARVDDLCFFFQAEDGIRDVAVTGVQTCALPISTVNPQRLSTVDSSVVESVSDGLLRLFLMHADADFEGIIHVLQSRGEFKSLAEPNLLDRKSVV